MYWALMKREALRTIWAKLELAVTFFYTFQSRDPRKRLARGGKFEVLTRNMSKYI